MWSGPAGRRAAMWPTARRRAHLFPALRPPATGWPSPPVRTTMWTLEAILPRHSVLDRLAPDGTGRQIMVANLDTVLVVSPLDLPIKPGLVDRAIVVAWESDSTPVLVLTKADLVKGGVDGHGGRRCGGTGRRGKPRHRHHPRQRRDRIRDRVPASPDPPRRHRCLDRPLRRREVHTDQCTGRQRRARHRRHPGRRSRPAHHHGSGTGSDAGRCGAHRHARRQEPRSLRSDGRSRQSLQPIWKHWQRPAASGTAPTIPNPAVR